MQKPIWSNDDSIITGYMLQVTYEEELGRDSHGSEIYPSVNALLSDRAYANHGYGVLKMELWRKSDHPDKDGVDGWMEFVGFNYEVGGAIKGNKIYPTKETCTEHEGYVKKYGVEKVRVAMIEVAVTENWEEIIKHSTKASEIKNEQNNRKSRP